MDHEQKTSLTVRRVDVEFSASDLDGSLWRTADNARITTYWSGAEAPVERHFTVGLLWSDRSLFVRFKANQSEPIVDSGHPETSSKSIGLWDRDVCEIFIAPDVAEPRRYFEFEGAPNGEWLDVKLDATSGERVPDWDYDSGFQVASRVGTDKVDITMRIPWSAFGRVPNPGDIWLGNIFRCVGMDPGRGYLAWRPTLTEVPSFHVPERFGEFQFTD